MPADELEALALQELAQLTSALDTLGDELDPELASDVLTIEFSDGDRFIINSHRAARQIWVAAERQAWHFDFDRPTHTWIARKTGDELRQLLERLLSQRLHRPVALR